MAWGWALQPFLLGAVGEGADEHLHPDRQGGARLEAQRPGPEQAAALVIRLEAALRDRDRLDGRPPRRRGRLRP